MKIHIKQKTICSIPTYMYLHSSLKRTVSVPVTHSEKEQVHVLILPPTFVQKHLKM